MQLYSHMAILAVGTLQMYLKPKSLDTGYPKAGRIEPMKSQNIWIVDYEYRDEMTRIPKTGSLDVTAQSKEDAKKQTAEYLLDKGYFYWAITNIGPKE